MATNCSTGFRRGILGPQSFQDLFPDAVIRFYGGTQPGSSDDPAPGPILAQISVSGGLLFEPYQDYMVNSPGQAWVIDGIATGTATWARLCEASDAGGASSTAPRIDFGVGPDGGIGDFQMFLPDTTDITPDTSIFVASWWFQIPAY